MNDALLAVGEGDVQPRRRRYSREFKRQVVEQSLQPSASAAQMARAYELNGNLLHTWRWYYRSGLLGPVVSAVDGKARRARELACSNSRSSAHPTRLPIGSNAVKSVARQVLFQICGM
jgi:transposase